MAGRAAYVRLCLRLQRDYGVPRILLMNSVKFDVAFEFWWAGRDSNPRSQRHLVYSQTRLTASVPTHDVVNENEPGAFACQP